MNGARRTTARGRRGGIGRCAISLASALLAAALALAACREAAKSRAAPSGEVRLEAADVAFLPLADEGRDWFCNTHEIRHYAGAALRALAAPAVRPSERDPFLVEAIYHRIEPYRVEPFTSAALVTLGRRLAVRYVVQPVLTKEGAARGVRLSIYDVTSGAEATSFTCAGTTSGDWPASAVQQALLDVSFAAVDSLTALPRRNGATAPDAPGEVDLAGAEDLARRWDLAAHCGQIDAASAALARDPKDARAWAMAARGYARLASDTRAYPARFHRECRLRATVAADLALRYGADDPGVRCAAAEARLAARRPVEAERLLEPPGGATSPHEAQARLLRATIRRALVEPPPDALATTPTTALAVLTGDMQRAARQYSLSLQTFAALLEKDRENVVLSGRHAVLRAHAGHPNNHLDAGVYHTLLALTQAHADLVPATWSRGPEGRRLARATLMDLAGILGEEVPAHLDDAQHRAAFRRVVAFGADAERARQTVARVRGMPVDGQLLLLLRSYGEFQRAFTLQQTMRPREATTPLALTLLDRKRLYDRLIVDGLGVTMEALDDLSVAEEGDRLAVALAGAFPDDETAQAVAGYHYYNHGGAVRPPLVTERFARSEAAWAAYYPQYYVRAGWSVPGTPLASVARRYETLLSFDGFDAALALTAARGLHAIRCWDDERRAIDWGLARDPYAFELRAQALQAQRARSGRPIAQADIEAFARDFAHCPAAAQEVADLLRAAGDLAEAEAVCRRILAAAPGDREAYFDLTELLRAQGRADESEALIGPFVARHADLDANRAVREAADFRIERREYDLAAALMARHAARLDPSEQGTIVTMGLLRWFGGDRSAAHAEFERYFNRYGRAAGPCRLAELEAMRGNWDEMRKLGDRLARTRTGDPHGHFLRAVVLLHDGHADQGRQTITAALQRMLQDPRAYELFARWHLLYGDFRTGARACRDGRRIVPGPFDLALDATAFRAALLAGDPIEAESILARLRLFAPNHSLAHACEALWRLHQRDVTGARRALEPARLRNPRDTLVRIAWGRILLGEGRVEEAVDALRSAIDEAHAPYELAEALLSIGEAYAAADRKDLADRAWQGVCELWPASYWADQAEERQRR